MKVLQLTFVLSWEHKLAPHHADVLKFSLLWCGHRVQRRCVCRQNIKTRRKPLKKWVILIASQFRYTFYRPQTKWLRARKIGLQYKIRKWRKQIWGRFLNPWNSNGIEWNRQILLTLSRILMYLPNTVGKRHKKAFKFIFGDRNLRLRDSAFVRCAPQQMVTEMT